MYLEIYLTVVNGVSNISHFIMSNLLLIFFLTNLIINITTNLWNNISYVYVSFHVLCLPLLEIHSWCTYVCIYVITCELHSNVPRYGKKMEAGK